MSTLPCRASAERHRRQDLVDWKDGDFKFMEMAAYLFEIGYNLAISLSNNVSDSPGLKGCGLLPKIVYRDFLFLVNACCNSQLSKISFVCQ